MENSSAFGKKQEKNRNFCCIVYRFACFFDLSWDGLLSYSLFVRISYRIWKSYRIRGSNRSGNGQKRIYVLRLQTAGEGQLICVFRKSDEDRYFKIYNAYLSKKELAVLNRWPKDFPLFSYLRSSTRDGGQKLLLNVIHYTLNSFRCPSDKNPRFSIRITEKSRTSWEFRIFYRFFWKVLRKSL